MHGDIKISCTLCVRVFYDDGKLQQHITEYHGVDGYDCTTCGGHYDTKKRLDRHKLLHSISYECKICGEKYAQRSQLQNHLESHETEKGFNCDGK